MHKGSAATEQDPWEAAYIRFETPQQEIRKFLRRLRKLGATELPRDAHVVELFCGRGKWTSRPHAAWVHAFRGRGSFGTASSALSGRG